MATSKKIAQAEAPKVMRLDGYIEPTAEGVNFGLRSGPWTLAGTLSHLDARDMGRRLLDAGQPPAAAAGQPKRRQPQGTGGIDNTWGAAAATPKAKAAKKGPKPK